MDTNERYTGPQPDAAIAELYAVNLNPHLRTIVENVSLTLEMVAVMLEDKLLEIQQGFIAKGSKAGEYTPSTAIVQHDAPDRLGGRDVVELRLNGWRFGTIV